MHVLDPMRRSGLTFRLVTEAGFRFLLCFVSWLRAANPWDCRFAFLAEEVLRDKQLKAEETRKAATRQLTRLIRNFGGMWVRDIREKQWIEYVLRERSIRHRTFFDDRKYMRLVLSHAARHGYVGRIIELSIPDLPAQAGRELESWELAALRDCATRETADGNGRAGVLNQKSPDLAFQIDIAWKMGLRLREMLRMRWDQISFERETIRLKARDRKNRRALEIPINPDLVPEFKRRKARAACQWVFPNASMSGPVDSNKTAWRRCKREAGVKSRWHDFRHHCASTMARAGVPRNVIKDCLGMSDQTLDKIYLHLNMDDKRQAQLVMTDAARMASLPELRKAVAVLSEKDSANSPRQMG